MPSKLKKAIGAVKDQTSISLAKVATGDGDLTTLEVAILKATSHDEEVPIDDRLVSEILGIISSKKSHAASCAAAIGRRIGRTRNWIVALKSLVLILRIFQDGDPYFPREILHAMKRGTKILNLSSFRDDSNSCSWDFTAFVRTFALYLDERLDCFLTGKLQRRYTNNRNQTGTISKSRFNSKTGNKPQEPAVRDMKPVMLLDKITYWQRLLDRAIATKPTGEAKSNKLVKTSLYAVVEESFDLYKDISDGLSLLLDSFFHLQYQSCLHAFQACVRASKQFEELNGFYDLCKSNGLGRTSEYPSIQKISLELLETLQEFLKDQSSFPSSKDSRISSSSFEDLMNKTSSPSMSCYSEPCGGEVEEEEEDRNENSFDLVSTKSLPINHSVSASNLTSDLLNVEEKKMQEAFDPWEALMLRDDSKKTIQEQSLDSENHTDSTNWLLALEETVTQEHDDTNSMEIVQLGLDESMPAIQATSDQYNPFLEEPAAEFKPLCAEPTFQVNIPEDFEPSCTPTFKAKVKCDPFESFGFEETFSENGGVNEKSMLQEQQLWLQNQDKIIAKHLN